MIKEFLQGLGIAACVAAVCVGGYYGVDYFKNHNKTTETQLEVSQEDKDTQIKTLLREKADLQGQLSAISIEKLNALERIDALTEELAGVNSELASKVSALATANASVTTLQSEKTSLQADIVALQSQKSALETQIAQLNASIITLNNELSAKTTTLISANATIVELQASIEAKNIQIATLQSEKAELQSQLATLQDNAEELQASIDEKDAQIATLQSEINADALQIASLTSALATSNEVVADVDAFIDYVTSEEEVEEPTLTSEKVQELYDLCMTAMAVAEDKITALYNEVDSLQNQISENNAAIATLNATIADKESALATANVTIASLQEDNADLQASVTSLTNQKSELQTQLATANANVQSLEAQIEELNAEIEELRDGYVDGWKIENIDENVFTSFAIDNGISQYWFGLSGDYESENLRNFLNSNNFSFNFIQFCDYINLISVKGNASKLAFGSYQNPASQDMDFNISFVDGFGEPFNVENIDGTTNYRYIADLDYVIDEDRFVTEFNAIISLYENYIEFNDVGYFLSVDCDYLGVNDVYYTVASPNLSIDEMIVLDSINNVDVLPTFCSWYDYSNITSIRLLAEVPQAMSGYDCIYYINTVYIPSGTTEAYTNASGWSDWLNASAEHQFVEYDVEKYFANMPAPVEVLQFSFEYDGSDITASFEDGMTWAEWAMSNYQSNFVSSNPAHNLYSVNGYMTDSTYFYLLLNNEYVQADDVIVAGSYTLTTTAPVVSEQPEE